MKKSLKYYIELTFIDKLILLPQSPSNLSRFTFLFVNLNLLLLIALSINELFSNLNNIETAMGGMIVCLIFSNLNVKYLTIFFKRDEIAKVLSMQSSIKFKDFEMFRRMYLSVTFLTIFAFLGYSTRNLTRGIHMFALFVKFPFDVYSNGLFPFALCWVHGVQALALVLNFKIDILTYKMIYDASMKFRKLREDFCDLRNCKITGEKVMNPSTSINLLSKRPPKPLQPPPISTDDLLFLLKRHCKLIELANSLKDICKVPFTYAFAINSIIICSIAFRMSNGQFSSFVLTIGLLYNIIRSFLQSFFAQLLKNSSEKVASGIYECGWEDFKDENCKRMIRIALMRAQKPETFTIFNAWEINSEQYLSVRLFKFLKYVRTIF